MGDELQTTVIEEILSQIKEVKEAVHDISQKQDKTTESIHLLNVRTSVLEVKSGLWGMIGGVISTAILVVAAWMKGIIGG